MLPVCRPIYFLRAVFLPIAGTLIFWSLLTSVRPCRAVLAPGNPNHHRAASRCTTNRAVSAGRAHLDLGFWWRARRHLIPPGKLGWNPRLRSRVADHDTTGCVRRPARRKDRLQLSRVRPRQPGQEGFICRFAKLAHAKAAREWHRSSGDGGRVASRQVEQPKCECDRLGRIAPAAEQRGHPKKWHMRHDRRRPGVRSGIPKFYFRLKLKWG